MNVVALSGKLRSGKSTVAQYLAERHLFTQLHFASKLKEEVALMGFTPEQVANKPYMMRKLMQVYGQTKRELVDSNYWVTPVLMRLAEMLKHATVVIDDLRFKNEAIGLKKWGREAGVNVKLIRIEKLSSTDPRDEEIDNDRSETDLDNYAFDCYIRAGEGDLDRLFTEIDLTLGLK